MTASCPRSARHDRWRGRSPARRASASSTSAPRSASANTTSGPGAVICWHSASLRTGAARRSRDQCQQQTTRRVAQRRVGQGGRQADEEHDHPAQRQPQRRAPDRMTPPLHGHGIDGRQGLPRDGRKRRPSSRVNTYSGLTIWIGKITLARSSISRPLYANRSWRRPYNDVD